ncbi:MAG: hypothetical protein IJM30_07755 [Thermoguttaceae bacterium]|nr:hypothetical protein [Thermoguttaceae bacterium]
MASGRQSSFVNFFRSSQKGNSSRKAQKTRELRLESLENRELLSVSTAEFEAIRGAYSSLDLPESSAEINVLEIQAEDLSYASVTRAIQEAAATPESDLIVLRTDDANYQLDLDDASFSIDLNAKASGAISLVSFGPRALQIATTSPEGVFDIASGQVGLGGLALIGFSNVGASELVSVDHSASLASDSLTLLTLSNSNVGGYSFESDANVADGQEELDAVPFTLVGSSDYYSAQGISCQQELGEDANRESWIVDFQYSEKERGFLSGLSTEEAIMLTTGTGSFQTTVYYDADKGRASGDGDDSLCWAGTSSNMLYYTGWAPQSAFPDEQAVFDVFIENFNDYGGRSYYGNGWFLVGGHDNWNQLRESDSGGFYSEQFSAYNESYTDYAQEVSLTSSVSGMNSLANSLRSGEGVGLGVDWTDGESRYGGHAITCWGYTYNSSLQSSDPNYYTRLFVTDSDDYQAEDRKLQDYAITWTAATSYYNAGYTFDSYGRGSYYYGYLRDFARLAQKPEKYVYNAEARLASPSLTAVAGDDSVSLTIGAVDDATGYVLQYGTSSSFESYETRTLTAPGSVEITGLQRATAYYFRVKATAEGRRESGWKTASATTSIYPDAFEPNDSLSSAYNLGTLSGVSTITGTVHAASDEDVFKFAIEGDGDSDHYVKLTYPHGSGYDLDMALRDANGDYITGKAGTSGVEQISLEGLEPGEYYVYIYNYYSSGLAGTYSLQFSAPDALDEFDLARPSVSAVAGSNSIALTIGAVANATSYIVEWSTASTFANCRSLTCGAGETTLTGLSELTTYYVRVKAIAEGYNDSAWKTISVATIMGRDAYEPNDSFSSAYDLGTLTGVSTINGTIHAASNKDYYKFTIDAAGESNHYVKLTYPHGSGYDLDMKLYKGDGTYVDGRSGTSGTELISLENLAEGEYCVYVYNYYSSGSVGRYSLEISAPDALGEFDLARPRVSAVASYNLIALTINAVENATSYVVEWATNSSFANCSSRTCGAGETTLTGLAESTTYYVRVKAVAEGYNDSEWRSISAKTFAAPDMYEPNNSRATAYDLGTVSGVRVYNANLNVGSDSDYFKFALASAGNSDSYVKMTYNSYADVDLEIYNASGTLVGYSMGTSNVENVSLNGYAAGTYYARVFNYYSSTSYTSAYALTISAPGSSIASPKLTVASATDGSATLTIGSVSGAEKYVLEYSPNANFSGAKKIERAAAGSVAVAGLTAESTYYFRVKAIPAQNSNSAQISDSVWTSVSATTLPAAGDPLDAPTFALSGTSSALVVKLYPVEGAESYVVDYSTDPSFATYCTKTYASTSTVKTISGLSSGTWRYVRVAAIAADRSDSGYSESAKIFTGSSLDMPAVSCSAVKSAVVLNIKPVANGESYVVEYSESADFSNARTKTYASSGVKTISGLTFGTNYYFRVKSTSSSANDSRWNSFNFAAGQLATPKFDASAVGSDFIKLRCYNVANASGFEAMWSTSSDFSNAQTVRGSSTGSLAITGLQPNSKYYFKVRALGDNVSRVDSNWTKIVGNATTKAASAQSANSAFENYFEDELDGFWDVLAESIVK